MSPHDYDSVRRQLDQLLGPERNKLPGTHASSGPSVTLSYDDPSVCKDYLLNFCLSSLAIKHKSFACNLTHSADALRQFKCARDARATRFWQQDLANSCRTIVDDEDRRIHGAARRLKESYGFPEPPAAIIVKDLGVLQELGLLVGGVEEKDEEDEEEVEMVVEKKEEDTGIKVLNGEEAKTKSEASAPERKEGENEGQDGLKKDGAGEGGKSGEASAQAKPRRTFNGGEDGVGPGGLLLNGDYKQRVCGQCGGLVSLYDAETRLVSHFTGQHHRSMVALRKKLRELEEELRGVNSSGRSGVALPPPRRERPGFERDGGGYSRGLRQGSGLKGGRAERDSYQVY